MTTTIKLHQLEELTKDFHGWYAECSCSAPDNSGAGAMVFRGDTPLEVASLFTAHQLETATIEISLDDARKAIGSTPPYHCVDCLLDEAGDDPMEDGVVIELFAKVGVKVTA